MVLEPSQVCPLNIKGGGNIVFTKLSACGGVVTPAMGRCDVTCWLRSIAWRRSSTGEGDGERHKTFLALLQKMPGLCRAEWPALFTLWGGASGWPRGLWGNHGPSGGWDHGKDCLVIIADLPDALLRFHVKIMPWLKQSLRTSVLPLFRMEARYPLKLSILVCSRLSQSFQNILVYSSLFQPIPVYSDLL